MNDNDARIEQFRSEIEQLKLKGSSSDGEKRLLGIGVLLVAAGVALAVVGAVQVVNAGDSAADQRAYMASGSFLGLALVIAGAALFVRYSLARYMRFWLIRMTYESRANTDRIVEAIQVASGTEPVGDVAVTHTSVVSAEGVPSAHATASPTPVVQPGA